MEPCNHMNTSGSYHRKREQASRKEAKARKHAEASHHGYGYPSYGGDPRVGLNPAFAGCGYYHCGGPFNYGYGYPSNDHYYHYQYGRSGIPRRYADYDEYVAMAPLTYRNGVNEFGTLHFADADPCLCYQVHYETPFMSFPQAPPPRKRHPFYTPETGCAIM